MQWYLFQLRGGDIETIDEEAVPLPGDAAAHERAILIARELLAAAVLEGRLPLDERIEIADSSGSPIGSVTFGQAVGLPD